MNTNIVETLPWIYYMGRTFDIGHNAGADFADEPILLVCDNSVFVKPLPELAGLLDAADMDYPYSPEKYPGVKKHYVIDADNAELLRKVVAVLVDVTPLPKPRKKKAAPK
ncbi:MAG: hypothetical protein LBK98_07135 [Peptococcaceae bacterium]|jgi:hypothetical protein|nr:hypothetical protein [Peptococcaceae bacterium]